MPVQDERKKAGEAKDILRKRITTVTKVIKAYIVDFYQKLIEEALIADGTFNPDDKMKSDENAFKLYEACMTAVEINPSKLSTVLDIFSTYPLLQETAIEMKMEGVKAGLIKEEVDVTQTRRGGMKAGLIKKEAVTQRSQGGVKAGLIKEEVDGSRTSQTAQMTKEELCDHYEKVASNVSCTYSTCRGTAYPQPWFECYTCWGGESSFGSCLPCALKCHKGHKLIAHPVVTSNFFCDCGKNYHQAKVCIRHSAGDEATLVPWYKCFTCFRKRDANAGCCYQCIKNCHRGHDVSFAGSRVGHCNCGNSKYTKAKCLIAWPKDQRLE